MNSRIPEETNMRAKERREVTVIELFFTIALGSFAFCLMVMTVQAAREEARGNTCSSNLRKMVLAMHTYESSNRKFPSQNLFMKKIPGNITSKNVPGKTSGGPATEASYSFIVQLLPLYEEGDIFKNINFDKSPFDAENGKLACQPISSLQCPSFIEGGK